MNNEDRHPPEGPGRDTLDRYYTPPDATQALLDHLGPKLCGTIWEPCCGKDWIGQEARKHPTVDRYIGTDVDPESIRIHWTKGGSTFEPALLDFIHSTPLAGFNWIVSNFPYSIGKGAFKKSAADFLRKALQIDPFASVAVLMRLSFLEPCKNREDIFANDPPTEIIILRRVHFIGAKSQNNCTSAWLIWDRSKPPGTPTITTWQKVAK